MFIKVVPSHNSSQLFMVVIDVPKSPEMCVTDPFSSQCSRFQVDPTTEWGATLAEARLWFETVTKLREEVTFDEETVYSSDAWINNCLSKLLGA